MRKRSVNTAQQKQCQFRVIDLLDCLFRILFILSRNPKCHPTTSYYYSSHLESRLRAEWNRISRSSDFSMFHYLHVNKSNTIMSHLCGTFMCILPFVGVALVGRSSSLFTLEPKPSVGMGALYWVFGCFFGQSDATDYFGERLYLCRIRSVSAWRGGLPPCSQ